MNEVKDEKYYEQEADNGLDLCKAGKIEEGLKHLRIAAEEGNNLDGIVNLGHALKLQGNYDEAFFWTKKGAELDHKTAISNLCIMLRHGQGCKCDVEETVKWANKLIDLGDYVKGYQEIINSYLYASDESQIDLVKAFEYAKEASDIIMEKHPDKPTDADTEVVIQLALCYDFGKGTEVNKKEAVKYYLYCAKNHMGIALYNLACIYAYEEDKDLHDVPRAIRYFKEAAKYNYGDAYYHLGYIYHRGEIVDKNINKAKYYYCKAIRNASFDFQEAACKENLKDISEELYERIISGKFCSIID